MVSLNTTFNNMPSEVYFFKSWATYQHPIKPTGPLEYQEALLQSGFYRAWMIKKSDEDLFVFFEGVENKAKTTEIKKPNSQDLHLRFYEFIQGEKVGREISASNSLDYDTFYVSIPDVKDYLMLIEQKKGISYEYQYDENGRLKEGTITDFDGNKKPLVF